ncbi:MAG: hypothetical protein ISR58_07010 [Anaerolineales bacterium]|nr:hypothetical protein [Chloroflexota bacterium]MBL6980925.1 hypothetical protein [Anaerolineales bacterium]
MDDQLNKTQPTKIDSSVGGDTSPIKIDGTINDSQPKKKGRPWLRRGGIVFLGLILVLVVGGFLGYQDGLNRRKNQESFQLAVAVAEQYELGVLDLKAGRYEVARQRFEYVIGLDPSYPGVLDRLAETLLVLNVTATPTPAPLPTSIEPTPTPDSRAEEELFAQAENYVAAGEWDLVIETLENLRKKNPDHRPVEIDGMLYLSLRQRGVQKIGLGNLEGGIYDLALAESFGVLDAEADGFRTWASLYITGASFWDVDWGQAVYYFEQLVSMTPNLHDGTGYNTAQRYVDALQNYGDFLESQGLSCEAYPVWDKAYQYTGNAAYQEKSQSAQDICE